MNPSDIIKPSQKMVTFTWDRNDRPSLAAIMELLDIKDFEIDHNFGLVEIDPDSKSYAILVESTTAARVDLRRIRFVNQSANPRIEGFALGEDSKDN